MRIISRGTELVDAGVRVAGARSSGAGGIDPARTGRSGHAIGRLAAADPEKHANQTDKHGYRLAWRRARHSGTGRRVARAPPAHLAESLRVDRVPVARRVADGAGRS